MKDRKLWKQEKEEFKAYLMLNVEWHYRSLFGQCEPDYYPYEHFLKGGMKHLSFNSMGTITYNFLGAEFHLFDDPNALLQVCKNMSNKYVS